MLSASVLQRGPIPLGNPQQLIQVLTPFVLFISLNSGIQAQDPVWTLGPLTFEVGDTVIWSVNWGIQGQQIENQYEITSLHCWDGWKISTTAGLPIDKKDSWLFDATETIDSVEVSHDGKSIDIHIIRNDSIPQTGWGLTLKVKGVVTEIEDLIFRKGINLNPDVKIYPNPADDYIIIQSVLFGKDIKEAMVYDKLGKKSIHWEGTASQLKWDISHLSAGMYLFYVSYGGKPILRKIKITHP